MDEVVKGLIKDEHVLVVATVCTETVEYARKIHDTWPTATAALGRVIAGAILLASTLKDRQKVMLQVKGDVGNGFLNVIRDLGLREFYQSSVELQTGEIATDIEPIT